MTPRTALIVGLALAALGAAAPRSIPDRLLERLDDSRAAAGAPAWERRSPLDRAAAAAAEEVAASARFELEGPIEPFLERVGVDRVRRAVPIVDVLRGYDDPVAAAVDHWNHYRHAWQELMSPEIDAIGLGEARARDGAIVLVAVLVQDPVVPDLARLERETSRRVNEARARFGLGPLLLSPELSLIARLHSEDMAARGYFSHRSPEGASVATRIFAAGMVFDTLGENLFKIEGAEGDPVPIVVDGWMTSAEHRANIVSSEFDECGVGVAVDDKGTLYFTQVFAHGARRASERGE